MIIGELTSLFAENSFVDGLLCFVNTLNLFREIPINVWGKSSLSSKPRHYLCDVKK